MFDQMTLIATANYLPQRSHKSDMIFDWIGITNLSVHSQTKLNAVARQLNERPRKTLEFETPAQRFNACVALTG